jgi:SAM-dependent methyltransferase
MQPNQNDIIASQVRQLYADYPYPNHGIVSGVVARMLAESVQMVAARVGHRNLRYLDAGCGTGEQTLGVARAHPTFRVQGIDRSQASLSVARALATRHGIAAEFSIRDLMAPLVDLGRFDIMTSIGVLHSLPKPRAGLLHLRALAAPHTILLGMVYGTFGKQELFMRRDILSMLCGEQSDRALRLAVLKQSKLASNRGLGHYFKVLRRRVRFGPDIGAMEALRRVVKGRSENYQADAYTHVQEETYTWAELEDLLASAEWKLLGWPARSGMPDRPEQVLRGQALEKFRGCSRREQLAIYERLVQPENLFFLAEAAGEGS